jgi:hypothetical protein
VRWDEVELAVMSQRLLPTRIVRARKQSGNAEGAVKRRKLTEILVETMETITIRRKAEPDNKSLTAWCAECGHEVGLISPEKAAELAGVSTRVIYRQLESGQLHFIEPAGGRLLICFNSAVKPAAIHQQQDQLSNKKEN